MEKRHGSVSWDPLSQYRRMPAAIVFLLWATGTAHGQVARRGVVFDNEAPRRHALVVGNAGYENAALQNTLNDARAMSSALRDLGFETITGEDLDGLSFDRQVRRFVDAVQPGDIALFYFAGHGVELNSENYLIPIDFRARDEAEATRQAYSASLLLEKLEARKPRLTIVILDACRNNPFRAVRSSAGGLAAMGGGAGVYIAFATAPGRTAGDNPGGNNGLFTARLVEALRKPGLTLHEVFDEVGARVMADSGGTQVPWTTSTSIGRFVFREAPEAQRITQGEAVNSAAPVQEQGTQPATSPKSGATPPSETAQQARPAAVTEDRPRKGLLSRLKGAIIRSSDERSLQKAAAPEAAVPPTPPMLELCPVTILSQPDGATILVDGYPAGRTPAVVKLKPGTYTVTLQAQGFSPHTQKIIVEAGQVRSFGVALETPK